MQQDTDLIHLHSCVTKTLTTTYATLVLILAKTTIYLQKRKKPLDK